MTGMDGLYHEQGDHRGRGYVGHVRRAPTSLTDTIEVTIETFGPATWGPCGWATRGTLLPPVGAECLVVFDDRGNPWVAAWQ